MLGGILIAAALPAMAAAEATATVRVENARVRALLPGQNKTAGYFDITNEGPRPVTLVGASSDAAGAIEFHRSTLEGDIVRMRRVAKVVVAPAETVRFRPGDLHLMLFRVATLAPHTRLQLTMGSGEVIDAVFTLVPVGVE